MFAGGGRRLSRGPLASGASEVGVVTVAFGDAWIAMSRRRRAITSWPPAAKAWLARS